MRHRRIALFSEANATSRGDPVTEAAGQSLDGIALFRPLEADERERLARRCRWRRYAPQEQVFDRNDEARDVHFLIEGMVRIVDYSFSGREVSFVDLRAGSYFGHLAAVDGRPRSASVVALTDAMVASLPPGPFVELVAARPALALDIMKNLAGMVRRSTDRIMDLSTLGANNRVHAEILRLAREHRRDDGIAVVSPIPVHSDIASRVSTTRETVARVFGDLGRAGLVERRSNDLVVKDIDRLEQIVEEVRGGE